MTDMSDNFIIQLVSEPEWYCVTFFGNCDENSGFPAVRFENKFVELDLAGLMGMNPAGAELWVNWVRTLPRKKATYIENCPVHMLHHFAERAEMLPAGSILNSFYIDYEHANAGAPLRLTVSLGQDFAEPKLSLQKSLGKDGQNYKLKQESSALETCLQRFYPQLKLIVS